jgi:hypothetical protein
MQGFPPGTWRLLLCRKGTSRSTPLQISIARTTASGFPPGSGDSAAEYGRSSYILHSSAIHHGIKQACPDGRSSGPRRPSRVWYRGASSVRLRHGQLGMAISAFGERAEVAEVFQLDGEVDVAGNARDDRREIEDGVDPGGDEAIGHVLSDGGGHGDNPNLVRQQRRTEMTDADQHDRLQPLAAEDLGDLVAQPLDVVPPACVCRNDRSCSGLCEVGSASRPPPVPSCGSMRFARRSHGIAPSSAYTR